MIQTPAFSCVLPRKPAYFHMLPSTSVFPYVLKHKRISIPGQAPAYLHMLLSTSVFPYVAKHQRISICCQAPALCFYVSPVMQNTIILLSCLQALRLPKHQRIFYGLPSTCLFPCVAKHQLFLCVIKHQLFLCVIKHQLFPCVPKHQLFPCVAKHQHTCMCCQTPATSMCCQAPAYLHVLPKTPRTSMCCQTAISICSQTQLLPCVAKHQPFSCYQTRSISICCQTPVWVNVLPSSMLFFA